MPVQRFRSVEEMSEPLWREPGPELWQAIERVWSFGARTGVHRFPPGVFRHRSIEEMGALAETWAEANFREFQERQRRLLDAAEKGGGIL